MFYSRHMRCEIMEKKKFSTFHNNKRGRARNRHDSSASGGAMATPTTPGPAVITLTEGDSIGGNGGDRVVVEGVEGVESHREATPPRPITPAENFASNEDTSGTLATVTEEMSMSRPQSTTPEDNLKYRARSGSCSSRTEELKEEARGVGNIVNRRRTGSVSKGASLSKGQGRGRGRSVSMGEVEVFYECTYTPWKQRSFPLTDYDCDVIQRDNQFTETAYIPRRPSRHVTSTSTSHSQASASQPAPTATNSNSVQVEGIPSTPITSRSPSPGANSSSSSTIIDDPEDPNDPEWTVISEGNNVKPERGSGIGLVLKLAKR